MTCGGDDVEGTRGGARRVRRRPRFFGRRFDEPRTRRRCGRPRVRRGVRRWTVTRASLLNKALRDAGGFDRAGRGVGAQVRMAEKTRLVFAPGRSNFRGKKISSRDFFPRGTRFRAKRVETCGGTHALGEGPGETVASPRLESSTRRLRHGGRRRARARGDAPRRERKPRARVLLSSRCVRFQRFSCGDAPTVVICRSGPLSTASPPAHPRPLSRRLRP